VRRSSRVTCRSARSSTRWTSPSDTASAGYRSARRADLSRTGLVAFIPRKGAFVSSPADADYEEVYLARDAIESAAVRVAAARATAADVADLRRVLRAGERAYRNQDLELAWTLDLRLHRRLLEIAGNRWFLELFDQLANVTLLLHHVALREGRYASTPPPELHRAIVDAIAGRDEERAVEAIERHFGYTADQPFQTASRR
jgi:DNA-binding GntR family transcriptional regulator